jgi:DNA-binding IclR family transcriptional regulator
MGKAMVDEVLSPEALRILEFLRRHWLEWFGADQIASRAGITANEALPLLDRLRAAQMVEQARRFGRYRAIVRPSDVRSTGRA